MSPTSFSRRHVHAARPLPFRCIAGLVLALASACTDATSVGPAVESAVNRTTAPLVATSAPARTIRRGDVEVDYDDSTATLRHRDGRVVRVKGAKRAALQLYFTNLERTDRFLQALETDPRFLACKAAWTEKKGAATRKIRVRPAPDTPLRPTSESQRATLGHFPAGLSYANYEDDGGGALSTCAQLAIAIYQATQEVANAESSLLNIILAGIADGLRWVANAWDWTGVSQGTYAAFEYANATVAYNRAALSILAYQYNQAGCWDPESYTWYNGGGGTPEVQYMGLTCHQEYVYLEEYYEDIGWVVL